MNKRQRKKWRQSLLIRVDTDRSGRLPDWWRRLGSEALKHAPRWPKRSKRYRAAMRKAGHAVEGGRHRGFALSCAGCEPMTWRQWLRLRSRDRRRN